MRLKTDGAGTSWGVFQKTPAPLPGLRPPSGLRRHRAQMEDAPAVAVGVDEAVRIHEAEVLRLVVGRAAGGEGPGDEVVDLLAARAAQADQDFHGLGRVADGFGGELAELGMREQHDMDGLADDDAGGGVVGELRVMGEAEGLEEGHRPGQIGDREVEE